jgi:hypothetical protein
MKLYHLVETRLVGGLGGRGKQLFREHCRAQTVVCFPHQRFCDTTHADPVTMQFPIRLRDGEGRQQGNRLAVGAGRQQLS